MAVETVSPKGLDLQERVIEINRVAKVVKGGRRFSFTALVAVGDEDSVVGIGYGKAREVPLAIQKAVEDARKNLIRIPKFGQTLTHRVIGRYGAGHVVLRPASPGTGVIAGGGVRAVLELGGVRDVLTKSIGTQNPINLVKATMQGLESLRRPEDVAKLRGISIREVLGVGAEAANGKAAEGDGAEAPRPVPVRAAEQVEPAPGDLAPGDETPLPDAEGGAGASPGSTAAQQIDPGAPEGDREKVASPPAEADDASPPADTDVVAPGDSPPAGEAVGEGPSQSPDEEGEEPAPAEGGDPAPAEEGEDPPGEEAEEVAGDVGAPEAADEVAEAGAETDGDEDGAPTQAADASPGAGPPQPADGPPEEERS